MTTSSTPTPDADRALREALHRVWGFSDFRPLQRDAMHAILDRRDSVVVLPTGGGKSLCFQAPAVVDDPAQDVASGLSRTTEGPPEGGRHDCHGDVGLNSDAPLPQARRDDDARVAEAGAPAGAQSRQP